MNIILLLKDIIITKKILQSSGRITHVFLPEYRENMSNKLIRLRSFVRVSANFWSNYQLFIRSKYISSINPLKAIPITTS